MSIEVVPQLVVHHKCLLRFRYNEKAKEQLRDRKRFKLFYTDKGFNAKDSLA